MAHNENWLSGISPGNLENGRFLGFRTDMSKLLQLTIDGCEIERNLLQETSCKVTPTSAVFSCVLVDMPIEIETVFKYDSATAVVHRQDRLKNNGTSPVSIQRCLSHFSFASEPVELYYQTSQWCGENQGNWSVLDNNGVRFRCKDSRTTLDATPFAAVRKQHAEHGIVFHVIPQGNWVIDIKREGTGLSVNTGLANDNLNLCIEPNAELKLPEMLIQELPDGLIHQATGKLHRYLTKSAICAQQKTTIPLIYNCWFDQFDLLEPGRLLKQVETAKELGCEVFVVDAGWYGGEDKSWATQTGDWRENRQKAFRGNMLKFADQVRQSGLQFGLWMEPERFNPQVPIVEQHPDWFLDGEGKKLYPDLSKPEVFEYIKSEISRLIETYQLAWIKVDYNFSFGPDPYHHEFFSYYHHWYNMIDLLKQHYPNVFFEGCASGGLRSDLNTANHFDNHFLSDNVNPYDVLRISQGAMLRLPPGKLGKWLVVRSIKSIPYYGSSIDSDHPFVIVPSGCGATWNEFETVNLDFACCVALMGNLGLSGDIASLSKEHRKLVKKYVAFYKQWRDFICHSEAHLLTSIQRLTDRSAWTAVQLTQAGSNQALLFAYRLNSGTSKQHLVLKELDTGQSYDITSLNSNLNIQLTGKELMDTGLDIQIDIKNQADIFIINHKGN